MTISNKRRIEHYDCVLEEERIIVEELNKLPKGKLIIAKNGNSSKYYYRNGDTIQYISTKEQDLIKKLAYRKYLQARLGVIESQKAVIKANINRSNKADVKLEKLLSNEALVKLLSSYDQAILFRQTPWEKESFIQSDYKPEKKIYTAMHGVKVRSKSEALIASCLAQYNIPFRYECQLILADGTIVYPDFTIKRPSDERIVYYEHFGMMDDPSYLAKNMKKIRGYAENDIFLNDQLIGTFESSTKPINLDVIRTTIEQYLL